ncbi:hypothetical protein [Azospirillum argentinense]|uniref:Uncharacterized protein n=2 Tax=Azospirillum brasilense TaxID=192 RepID=A0A4D8PTE7_AZOBR|nr:hypothetical protein [Azospirillum argentinense]QCO00611.1 hypothetical protein D3867_00065 [Azospirillum argentinense]
MAYLQDQLKAHLNKIDEIDLQPLTQGQLGEFLEKVFETITPDLAARIWQLSGGLPLHLASLWNILFREGAIEKVDGARFHVLRPSVFENIEIKGGRGASLIQTRLAKVPWETVRLLSDAASFPTSHLASLLAHLHDAEQIGKFKALAEIDEIDFEKFCHLLVGEGLIHPVPPGGSDLRFRHDLLRQGLRGMVVPDRRSQDTTRIILGKVDTTTASPGTLELYSDIANWAGFSWEAITALEAALAQLNNSIDFSQRKRLRRKLIQRLSPDIDENDPTAMQRLIAHRIALGWEEWNTGSIVEARTLFHAIAADCLKRIKRGDGGGWPERNAANALRRAVGLELELGDPVAMAKTARQALGLRTGWIEYNSILNRLVLYCARYSQVFLGKRFAKLALRSFSGLDPAEGARSVICSDIGSLFRASAPDTALFFYRKALEVSKREDDFRQHTYSQMELALTEALLDAEARRTIDIDRLRSDLHQAGLQDMLSRVDMVSGALAMLEGRIETGRMQTERALTSAHMYGRRHLLIAAENDALIGALAAGDKERSKELAVSLLKRLKLHLEIRKRSAVIVADIEPLALQAATRLGDVLTPWELPMPAQPPLFSGTWVGALLNLKQIAAARSQLGRVLAPACTLWPDDMDEDACRSVLAASTINCRLKVGGLSLAFCAN